MWVTFFSFSLILFKFSWLVNCIIGKSTLFCLHRKLKRKTKTKTIRSFMLKPSAKIVHFRFNIGIDSDLVDFHHLVITQIFSSELSQWRFVGKGLSYICIVIFIDYFYNLSSFFVRFAFIWSWMGIADKTSKSTHLEI